MRARVKEFYDYHVKGKPRLAEALVAEDSKDIFYANPKPQFLSCVTDDKIEYSDHFKKAKVTEVCKQTVVFPGAPAMDTDVPMPSYWKLEDGKWVYYVDPVTAHRTPFGEMKAGAFPPNGAAPSAGLPADIGALGRSLAAQAMEQVKLDKSAVSLKPGESADITITNTAPGPMTLALPANSSGIDAKLDKTHLEAGGKAVLKLHARESAVSGAVELMVEQTGQHLPIQVTVPN